MKFIKKNLFNIVFFGFIILLITPFGLPLKAFLIKGMSMVTTRVFHIEIDENERVKLSTYQWQLLDLQGEKVNLNEFENQVIIVNFWATWCPPCIAEMPSFQILYDDYKDKVVFLFIAQDDENKVRKFLIKKKHDIPVYFETSRRPEEMNSNSLPTTYIINKEGQIVVNKTGAVDWNSNKVRELLDKLIKSYSSGD